MNKFLNFYFFELVDYENMKLRKRESLKYNTRILYSSRVE